MGLLVFNIVISVAVNFKRHETQTNLKNADVTDQRTTKHPKR